jgi:hypothetical protein
MPPGSTERRKADDAYLLRTLAARVRMPNLAANTPRMRLRQAVASEVGMRHTKLCIRNRSGALNTHGARHALPPHTRLPAAQA